MSEFYDSREFNKLPDEFNRDYRETKQPARKKNNKLLSLLISFVTVTLLVYPLTITGHGHHHADPDPEPWPGPDPWPSPPDVVEEYEIIGMWESQSGQYYEFFEDGTGYWTDSNLFVPLKWEESGNDYHVYGEGMYVMTKTVLTYGATDMITIYDNGQLYLQTHSEDNNWGMEYFSKSERTFDLTNIKPLLNQEGTNIFAGEWVFESAMEGPDDGKYVIVSFLQISDDNTTFLDLASTVSDRWAGYELPYVYDIQWPNTMIIIGDGTRMYFEEYPAPNTTYTYETYELYAYKFIDIHGEGLLVTGMNQNIMRKFVWERRD